MEFSWFKSCHPTQTVFRAMGLGRHLDAAGSWNELRSIVVEYNDNDSGFVDAARRYDGMCSSGERVLLHAILYVTDFAWLADELDDGRTWRRMANVSGIYRQAVMACLNAEL